MLVSGPHPFLDGQIAMVHRLSRSRPLLPAALFTAAIFALSWLSLSTLYQPPVLGAGTVPMQDGSQRLTWVMPGGYAYEAGLHSGDVIRLLPPPHDSSAWGVIQFAEGDRAGQTILLQRRWPAVADQMLFILGLEFLLAGLIVYRAASDRPAANRFALMSAACAITFVAFPAIGNGYPWALATEWFGSKIGMAAFALFFLNTPVPRWRRLHPFLIWIPVPILALYCFTVLARPDLYALVKPIGYSYMAFGLVVSLAAMAWPFATGAVREQRRMWPVLLASGLAAVLYLLASLIPYLLFRRYLLPAEIAITGISLLPLGFVWAMVRHPIMGISLGPWAVVKTVFESIADPIFVVGRDGQLIDASRSGLALLGISKVKDAGGTFDQMAGRLLSGIEQDGSSTLSLAQRVLDGVQVRDLELTVRDPRDVVLHLSLSGTPLLDEAGRVELAVLVCHDITARKRKEEERRELDRQKDEFLAGVSHDLKTPLTAIKSSVGIVLANEPPGMPEPLHRMLVNVDVASDRMAAMVEDLLEMARLQSGRIELRLHSCRLNDLAMRAVAAIQPLAASREQRVEIDLPPDPIQAQVDEGRLERALNNLLGNAQRYGQRGGVIRLTLRLRSDEAIFAVTDDGPGIPEAEQQRIFDRFYRLESGVNGWGGTGLGLPIARAMAELHGGRLWVESRPGSGSTFWLAIPTTQGLETPARSAPPSIDEDPINLAEVEGQALSEGRIA